MLGQEVDENGIILPVMPKFHGTALPDPMKNSRGLKQAIPTPSKNTGNCSPTTVPADLPAFKALVKGPASANRKPKSEQEKEDFLKAFTTMSTALLENVKVKQEQAAAESKC